MNGCDRTVDLIYTRFGQKNNGNLTKHFAVTQMPHETDSANPSTVSSFKTQAQVIDGNTSAGLYAEV